MRTLNTMSVVERRGWASRVQAQMGEQMPLAECIVIFAGKRYRDLLMDYLKRRCPIVEIPMERLPIGKQLHWLRSRVDRLSDAIPHEFPVEGAVPMRQ